MELILASGSPRRKKLLCDAGFTFRVIEPGLVEEQAWVAGLSAVQQARSLALAKALAVAEKLANALVLGADTVVVLDEKVIGKARDGQHARRILSMLSGSDHQVITALALLEAPRGKRLVRHQATSLSMVRLSERQIDQYLRSGLWQGKAGAYALQEKDAFVTKIEGSFSNVVGLPLELFEQMLGDLLPAQSLLEFKP